MAIIRKTFDVAIAQYIAISVSIKNIAQKGIGDEREGIGSACGSFAGIELHGEVIVKKSDRMGGTQRARLKYTV